MKKAPIRIEVWDGVGNEGADALCRWGATTKEGLQGDFDSTSKALSAIKKDGVEGEVYRVVAVKRDNVRLVPRQTTDLEFADDE